MLDCKRIAASALVKTGPGVLHSITISGTDGDESVKLWDNTAASGTQLFPLISVPVAKGTVHINLPKGVVFSNLYATIAGAGPDVGITYR